MPVSVRHRCLSFESQHFLELRNVPSSIGPMQAGLRLCQFLIGIVLLPRLPRASRAGWRPCISAVALSQCCRLWRNTKRARSSEASVLSPSRLLCNAEDVPRVSDLPTAEHCRHRRVLFSTRHRYSLILNELCLYWGGGNSEL